MPELTEAEIASLAARRASNMRTRASTTCVVCGKPIEGIRKRRFCSHACTLKDYRARHRGQAGPAAPASTGDPIDHA